MKLLLNSVITKPFELEINADEKVSTLQTIASEFCNNAFGLTVPKESKLIHKGFVLDSTQSLSECNVQELDYLLILFKLSENIPPPSQVNGTKKEAISEIKEIKKEEARKEEEEPEKDETGEEDEIGEEDETGEEVETGEYETGEYESEETVGDVEDISEDSSESLDIHGNIRPEILEEFGSNPLQTIVNIAAQIDWSDFPFPNPIELEGLISMGFPKWRCQKALLLNGFNPDLALDWLLANSDNPNVDDLLSAEQLSQIISIVPEEEMGGRRTIAEKIIEAVANNKCTFTVTGRHYTKQKWFFCYSCGFVDSEGICESCANVCHKGHSLSEPKGTEPGTSFFCDCGSGDTCLCNK